VKVALLTPYDGGNLGDAAIQEALIGNFQKYDPQAQFYGITLHPENTAERHHIPCYPLAAISRPYYHAKKEPSVSPANLSATSPLGKSVEAPTFFERVKSALRGFLFRTGLKPLVRFVQECVHILRSYRLLRNVDMLVVAGGGQLDEEWGGSWGHPYALAKWAVLARAARTAVMFLSVGGCRTDLWLTNRFLKVALSLACYRSYRDEGSRQIARAITPTADGPVVPDLAFSLSFITQPSTATTKSTGLRVGVSPITYARTGMWPTEDAAQYERYMTELVLFVGALLKRGTCVTLFSSSSPDEQLFDDLRDRACAHGVAAFANGEAQTLFESYRGDKCDFAADVVAGHHHFNALRQLHVAGDVRGAEVKLWTVAGEKRGMAPAFFLGQHVRFGFELGVRRDRARLANDLPALHVFFFRAAQQEANVIARQAFVQ